MVLAHLIPFEARRVASKSLPLAHRVSESVDKYHRFCKPPWLEPAWGGGERRELLQRGLPSEKV